MHRFTMLAVCLIALFFATLGYAQPACPVGQTGLQVLQGTWSFELQGFQPVVSDNLYPWGRASSHVVSIIGQFTATLDAQKNLLVSEVVNIDGGITVYTFPVQYRNGQVQVEGTCAGGTMNFGSGNTGLDLYTFVFANNFTEMYIVSVSSPWSIVGRARRF